MEALLLQGLELLAETVPVVKLGRWALSVSEASIRHRFLLGAGPVEFPR